MNKANLETPSLTPLHENFSSNVQVENQIEISEKGHGHCNANTGTSLCETPLNELIQDSIES